MVGQKKIEKKKKFEPSPARRRLKSTDCQPQGDNGGLLIGEDECPAGFCNVFQWNISQ